MNENILVYPVYYQSRKDIIKIKPILDVHKGSREHDRKAFLKYISEYDENTYFTGVGDLWDAIYFRDKRFKASGHQNTDIDDPIDEEIEEMKNDLLPIKDRIIGIGHGNHEETILKMCHTNMSKRLARALGVPFLGYSYWIRLRLKRQHHVRDIDVFCQHGFGGGTRTEGGSVTKYSKHADRIDCDIYIVGHDHRLQFVKYPILAIAGEKQVKMFSKPKLVCLGGSWKKVFSDNTATSWEETKGFNASFIGGITIQIKETPDYVDINASM